MAQVEELRLGSMGPRDQPCRLKRPAFRETQQSYHAGRLMRRVERRTSGATGGMSKDEYGQAFES